MQDARPKTQGPRYSTVARIHAPQLRHPPEVLLWRIFQSITTFCAYWLPTINLATAMDMYSLLAPVNSCVEMHSTTCKQELALPEVYTHRARCHDVTSPAARQPPNPIARAACHPLQCRLKGQPLTSKRALPLLAAGSLDTPECGATNHSTGTKTSAF